MSEKIYACLLRLFPSHFREAHGDEALQLFRDRVRDEKGFFPRVRLWLAAEQFCYDLKMLKRVTLVGETTRGSTHAGLFHRIDDHFGMGIPEVLPVNPFSQADWEGTGVDPDVKVNAAQALETAQKLAEDKLQKK